MPMVRPICPNGTEHPKNRHMAGSAGVYMSLTNDPSELISTRNSTRNA